MPGPHDTAELAPQLSDEQLEKAEKARLRRRKQSNKQLVADTLAERNVNPVEVLLGFAEDETLDKTQRIGIYKEFLKYMVPQMKALDITADVHHELSVKRVMFSDMEQQRPQQQHPPLPPAENIPEEVLDVEIVDDDTEYEAE